jgi:hypothetical protein
MRGGSSDTRTDAVHSSAEHTDPDQPGEGELTHQAQFIEELRRRRHVGVLDKTVGTIRLDIVHRDRTDHWLVSVNLGDLHVTSGYREADCAFQMDETAFRRLAEGETVPFAAYLSNEVAVNGRFNLLIVLQQLFHGRPDAHDPRELAERERRRS